LSGIGALTCRRLRLAQLGDTTSLRDAFGGGAGLDERTGDGGGADASARSQS
jgi:hypothetical protein